MKPSFALHLGEYPEDEGLPEGWAYEMLDFCGSEVTINYCGYHDDGSSEYQRDDEYAWTVHIEEDDSEFVWRPIDFDPIMEKGNPNSIYLRQKAQGKRKLK